MIRQPQASKLRARVDVAFRLITAPDGELVEIPNVPCSAVDWTRNAPGMADTCTVTLPGDALPFDLRIIADKSMFASVWLYEQDAPDFTLGGPGHFFGVVDDAKRDRYGLQRVTLSCRDLTAVPLGAKMREEAVKAFEVIPGAALEDVVGQLLYQIPGTFRWLVESRTVAGVQPLVPLVQPKRAKKGSTTKVAKTSLGDIVGAEGMTVWTAIGNLCARAGAVPEVMMGADGNPVVVLVGASDLQTSDVLRPFQRSGRTWRVFVDGDGISTLRESLDLAQGEQRPDFVQVASRAPGAARSISARWPEASGSKDDKSDSGLFQWVDDIESVDVLKRMARAGYESLAHNQYTIELAVKEPWSAGGGPRAADLLDLGFGAAIEIQQPAFDAATAGLTAQAVLERRGVSADLAAKVAAAQQRIGALSLLFQCAEVQHSWSAADYTCTIRLRQFLGRESAPIFNVEDPRGFA